MVNQDWSDTILTFVITSGILGEYHSRDVCLARLIGLVSERPGIWKERDDIAVSSQPSIVTSDYERVWRRRLRHIPNEPHYEPLRNATTQLVNYCESYPGASIWGVTFNCPTQSYGIFCGQVDDKLDSICVMIGKHIPEYAMRRPLK